MNRIVVHYHEVALKRGNRSLFVNQLVENIAVTLRGTGVKRVKPLFGRIAVHLRPDADHPEIVHRLRRVAGIANFSAAWRAERHLDDIIAVALGAIGERRGASFAVRAKRGDKSFPMGSMELASLVGEAIGNRTGMKVNLRQPEIAVHIEVAAREVFVFLAREAGLGGLPVGTGGQVLVLLSGGIDSPVAAFRLIRRGCRAELLHFHGAPYQDRTSREKSVELAKVLTQYQMTTRLHQIAFGEIQRQIVAAVPRPYRVVLYRRMMMRIADALAAQTGAQALVTGESLGQVASQTIENMTVVGQATGLPLFRPLIGMDKAEITREAQQIGTYEISIQPDQDCCQLFVPKQPATRMTPVQAEAAEHELDIAAMIEQAMATRELTEFAFPESPAPRQLACQP
ncbi:MAG TPA: tRNA uracil 4-sulfurtransferase ThiI [Terriglobales bacterium]|nr:tRNA uracil 4-sulfurtransferase ThiI [Terriglobales bacterium]